jgi:Tol biopolymer transport system component
MRRTVIGFALLCVAFTGAVLAQQRKQSEIDLQAAIRTETVELDLNGAIARYKKLVEQYGTRDRGVAASALLHLAECYRKQGDAQARKVYERIVREFGDQKIAVATARTRLDMGSDTVTTGILNKQIWTGSNVDITGTVSADGRYLSFVDWDTGDLAVHDFTRSTERRLTNKGTWEQSDDFAEESAISPDGTDIAYSWFDSAKRRYVLRALRLSPAGFPAPRTLLDNPDVFWTMPFEWSPDGKRIAVLVQRNDRVAQIGLLGKDGTLNVLKSVDWRGPRKMSFSPDGRFLAYDLPVSDVSEQRDIFVMSTDASPREVTAVAHPKDDVVMGWAPDGSLLFTSDRAGSSGLWSLAMADGKPAGMPIWLRDIDAFGSLGMRAGGSLVYGVRTSTVNVYVGEMDFHSGKMVSSPRQVVESLRVTNIQPQWSLDGTQLVYVSESRRNTRTLSTLRLQTNEVSQMSLHPMMNYFQFPQWAPDGSFTVQGRDLKGRQGIYRIDSNSGDVSPLVVSEPGVQTAQPTWSPDGRRLVYLRLDPTGGAIVVRNMDLGQETELVRAAGVVRPSVSPNGKEVIYRQADRMRKTSALKVVSIDGGTPRTVIEVAEPQMVINFVEWTPEGNVLFGLRGDTPNDITYWSIPAAGGQKTRLSLSFTGPNNSLSVHPDGRHVAFQDGKGNEEVWILENFLPAATKTARK